MEFDSASPYLYKALSKGQTLKSAELRWYRIDDSGREKLYFTMLLENVKVSGINPGMPNVKTPEAEKINHVESVALMYEKITWHYEDGHIEFADTWNER